MFVKSENLFFFIVAIVSNLWFEHMIKAEFYMTSICQCIGGKVTVNKNLIVSLLVILFGCGLLLAISCSDTSLERPIAKDKQPGRKKVMTDQANPNIGKRFPEVTAESLAKTSESIPDSAEGKVALIAVAFLQQSQSQLDSWLEPFAEKFGSKEGFTFYEVPMISSGYKFMRFVIDSGMRGGIPKEKHKNVVTMYGDVEKYMNELNLEAKFGYAFLLDQKGIIRWQGQGFSNPDSLKELFELAENLA
jgi:hypothetical protein